jgi:outer membrane protein assembly factor BamB
MKSFPNGAPALAWTYEQAGIGYSGFSVVGKRLYSMGDEGKEEFVFALDTATGKEVWRKAIGKSYSNGYGGGPRCTPTVDGDALYILGAHGDLARLATGDGKVQWTTNFIKDLKGTMPTWGYCESPLVDGDQVIASPGGGDGTVAAFEKETGKLKWRSSSLGAAATYSSIVVSEAAGVRHYVQMTSEGVAGFAPKDGKVLWQQNVAVNRVATVPTPIIRGEYVYATSDYGAGCALVKLSATSGGIKSEVVYKNKVMQNHHGGVVLVGDNIYGFSGGTNDRKPLPLVCQDFKSGKAVWQKDKTLEASGITFADGHLYCYGQITGTLLCIEATSKEFVERGRFTIPKETTRRSRQGGIWTHPVIADGKIYLRDQELLYCFDIRDGRASGE